MAWQNLQGAQKRGFTKFLRRCKKCGHIFKASYKGVKVCLPCRTTKSAITWYIRKNKRR